MSIGRGAMQSGYMHWAKYQRPVRYSLSSSDVTHFRLDRLPLTIADLDLDGASHIRYAPLRRAISERYGASPEMVVTANGTSMANFLAMATLVAPGDEVFFERPAYEPMLASARFLGADVRWVERQANNGFRLDIDQLEAEASKRTRLIALTNPHNPSGALTNEQDMRAIGVIAERCGAHVLVDEVYLDSAVPPRATSALLGPQFVITNSLTKVYGLSGLRCGWILAEAGLAERMWRLNDLFGVNQPHQSETLSSFAFDHLGEVSAGTFERLARNRALFNEFIATRRDLLCMAAEHGVTAFPRWLGGDTEPLDALLREKYDTSIVPGRWFDMPDHFRVSLGGETGIVNEGLKRLELALDEFA
ncbi:pyridoxal phosphate-dependent aminotransferase [Sphingomonas sp. RB56-2]|uniref:Pyridoxal phosphate-dependent aminotransferase n=1 Tax=Sphingomonas brevis TaxID=2908206 RepID=A0ABT0S8D9_9SPHN|nr:pyridoxal phosphate-dependent aminotransferase [Sphingomonas brevis]MCL6740655.1 pyridoxal phosphate-dependent aminotransferase [Sphingomonas brevis]